MNKYTITVSPSGICSIISGIRQKNTPTVFTLRKTANGYSVTIGGETYEAVPTGGWHMECDHKTAGAYYLAHLNRALFTAHNVPMPAADALLADLEAGQTVEICHTYNEPFEW